MLAVVHRGDSGRLTLITLGVLVGALLAYDLILYRHLSSLDRRVVTQEAAVAAPPRDHTALLALAGLSATVLERAPESMTSLSRLASRLAEQGDAADAEAALQQGIRLSPRSGYPHYAYGVFLRQLGRHDAAIAEFREARNLSPTDPLIPAQLGITLFDLNQRREAEAAFRDAIRLDPVCSEAYLGLAYVNQTPSRFRKAMEYAKRFNQLRPKATEGHVMLARLHLDLRQFPEAAAAARTALGANPNDSGAWHLLGLAYAVAPDTAPQAVESFTRALRLNPEYPPTHYELGRLLLQQGRVSKAVEELRTAADLWPWNGGYHWTLMQALRRAGDAEGAAREARLASHYTRYKREQKRLNQRIADHPGEVRYHEELARLHLEYGHADRAARILGDALATSPNSPQLQALLHEVRGTDAGSRSQSEQRPALAASPADRP